MSATPVLVIGSAQKAPGDKVRLPIDLGDDPFVQALLLDADGNFDSAATAVASYNVTCSGTGAPTVTAKTLDYAYQVSALFSGGSQGTYEIVYSATLADADGTILVRTGSLQVL